MDGADALQPCTKIPAESWGLKQELPIHACTLPVFILDPHEPGWRKGTGSTQTCPPDLLQPAVGEYNSSRKLNIGLYCKQRWVHIKLHQLNNITASSWGCLQENPALIQRLLPAMKEDRQRESCDDASWQLIPSFEPKIYSNMVLKKKTPFFLSQSLPGEFVGDCVSEAD